MRRKHRLSQADAFLLGDNSRGTLQYHGMRYAILARAEAADLSHFNLHQLRHTAASRWLSHGGTEGGAMAMMGWNSPRMLYRYVAATAADRATEEARRLNLGDI
jgi:integrase